MASNKRPRRCPVCLEIRDMMTTQKMCNECRVIADRASIRERTKNQPGKYERVIGDW